MKKFGSLYIGCSVRHINFEIELKRFRRFRQPVIQDRGLSQRYQYGNHQHMVFKAMTLDKIMKRLNIDRKGRVLRTNYRAFQDTEVGRGSM